MTDPNPPLWEVMHDALGVIGIPPKNYAAELRAIVSEIQRRWDAVLPDNSALYCDTGMEIVAWLLAEADRAETGDG